MTDSSAINKTDQDMSEWENLNEICQSAFPCSHYNLRTQHVYFCKPHNVTKNKKDSFDHKPHIITATLNNGSRNYE